MIVTKILDASRMPSPPFSPFLPSLFGRLSLRICALPSDAVTGHSAIGEQRCGGPGTPPGVVDAMNQCFGA